MPSTARTSNQTTSLGFLGLLSQRASVCARSPLHFHEMLTGCMYYSDAASGGHSSRIGVNSDIRTCYTRAKNWPMVVCPCSRPELLPVPLIGAKHALSVPCALAERSRRHRALRSQLRHRRVPRAGRLRRRLRRGPRQRLGAGGQVPRPEIPSCAAAHSNPAPSRLTTPSPPPQPSPSGATATPTPP